MDISVIIPTFRPNEYIYECLLSLNIQSFSKNRFEVIIILNGCRDPYKSLLQQYIDEELTNLSVVLIQTDVAGVSNARNLGMSISNGEYICFIDDDDVINETYLESLYEQRSKDSVVCAHVYSFDDHLSSKFETDYLDAVFKKKGKSIYALKVALSSSCAKLIPCKIIDRILFTKDITVGEDALFMFKISKNIKQIKLADQAIYYRRKRTDSASRKKYSLKWVIQNRMVLIRNYTIFYAKNIHCMNVFFFLNRIGAIIKSTFKLL